MAECPLGWGDRGTGGNRFPAGQGQRIANSYGKDRNSSSVHLDKLESGSPRFPGPPSHSVVIELLKRAAGFGMTLTAVGSWLDWQALAAPPAAFLEELQVHKVELLALLRGERCRYCSGAIDWRCPSSVGFADQTGAHLGCYERAENDSNGVGWGGLPNDEAGLLRACVGRRVHALIG